jgi:putative flippase GtrA
LKNPRTILQAAAQLVRFCGVGLICLVASTAVLAALHNLAHLHYLVAYAIAFCCGNVLGYSLNGRFTFATRLTHTGILRYLLLNGGLLAVNSLLMRVLVEGAHVWYIAASLMLALANAPVSFLLHRSFSYAVPSTQPQHGTAP